MKVIILAGGKGTRIREATDDLIPKPMIMIGDRPMLEHIMEIYAAQGFNDFIVAAGFMGEQIMYWAKQNKDVFRERGWTVSIGNTGENTQTGGRLLRIKSELKEPFMMTYGDGLADVNLHALELFHFDMYEKGCAVTLTAVNPPSRFGMLDIFDGFARLFTEKTQTEQGWINGGFYYIQPEIFDYINGDMCRLEFDVLPVLALQNKLAAYQHPGYFQMCDTWRDWDRLKKIWQTGEAPWARMSKQSAA